MRQRLSSLPSTLVIWLAIGVCLSVGVPWWLGYHAIQEWRSGSLLLAERRASEAADLLTEALMRDMQGAQRSVLNSPKWSAFSPDRPYEFINLVAGSFARYPYPESFFAWRGDSRPDDVVFFNRSNRLPQWISVTSVPDHIPVAVHRAAEVAARLQTPILKDARRGQSLSVSQLRLDDIDYQVVAQMTYEDDYRERLLVVSGFTVNLNWVRSSYFPELTRQVYQISGGSEAGLDLTVSDPHGVQIAGSLSHAADESAPTHRRPFPLLFFDPMTAEVSVSQRAQPALWSVEVSASNDPTLAQAITGANRTLVIGATSALTLAVALLWTISAARANTKLTELRSDFVSAVTHDLKTPIASIRAVGETLSSGRLMNVDSSRDYGHLIVLESKRLARLVENLLAYSRVTDLANVYTFRAIDLSEFFEALQCDFQTQLDQLGFDFRVDLETSLPPARGDWPALRLLFDNLVDNSLRYSDSTRELRIAACAVGGAIKIDVIDAGIGISPEDIRHITRKFVRGRSATSNGSGLGLAIASRIAIDHSGTLRIQSQVEKGTRVTVTLPAM